MTAARPSSRLCALTAAVLTVPLALVGCGSSSKGGTSATTKSCTPKAGTSLVVLADDKHSQNSDNIVPVVKTSLAKAPLTDALNAVSKALSQDALNTLNSDVSVSGKTDAEAAAAFISKNNVGSGLSGGSGNITVGTQSFAEASTLGEVYKEVLTKAGYTVTVKKIGLRNLLEPALESGEVTVVPEYAASLTQFLLDKDKDTSQSASTEIDKTMAVLKPLALKHGFTALDPAAATDENAYAVTKATSDAYGLKTMSDVADKCGTTGITFGAAANCPSNPFCAAAIKKVYGITIAFKSLDADGPLTRAAVKQGKVLIGEVFSSDPDLVQAG
ncbi:MAG TPA: glycine betaine ABC transporter substrate-binding protein [Frankiaceae bacterium]|jgi:osmoprotectant transport system substrate-binding protein|nr:glycine betaine ABC transporter substrate-binding protein [Frankiaceae bacterium]